MSNYDKHAARRLMAENPGMNYTAALRTVREKRDEIPWDVSDFLSASLADIPHLDIVGHSGSGKSVLLRHLEVHRLSLGYDVFVIDTIKGGIDHPSEDFLAAPVATSDAGSIDLLKRVLESRSGLPPALVVVDELSALVGGGSGDLISMLINSLLRTGRSNQVDLALSRQGGIHPWTGEVRTEGLTSKVLVGTALTDAVRRWIGQDHASAITSRPQKGIGLYNDGSGAEKFTFPHFPARDVEAALRAAGVPTREERDR